MVTLSHVVLYSQVCYWFCSLEEAMVYIRTLEFQHRVKFALRRTQKCDKGKAYALSFFKLRNFDLPALFPLRCNI